MPDPRPSPSPSRLLLLALALLALVGALAGCGGDEEAAPPDELRGSQRTPAPDVSEVTLPDASAEGADFAFVAEQDQILLAYFGFTACPDVCPTTLADVRTALKDLGDDAASVDLAMVTVDPDRDDPETLTGYVQSFVPEAHALVTSDPDELRAAADAFGADYSIEEGEGGEPEVTHTAFLYAVDDQGKLVLTWPFGTPPEDITHDLEILLDAR